MQDIFKLLTELNKKIDLLQTQQTESAEKIRFLEDGMSEVQSYYDSDFYMNEDEEQELEYNTHKSLPPHNTNTQSSITHPHRQYDEQ